MVNSAPASKVRDPFPPAIRLLHQGIIDLRPLVTHVVPLVDYRGTGQRRGLASWDLTPAPSLA